MNNSTAKPKPSGFALLVAAVASLAAAFSLTRATVRRDGKRYYIEYAWFPGQPLTHTEATGNAKQALRRYEKALGDDYAAIH